RNLGGIPRVGCIARLLQLAEEGIGISGARQGLFITAIALEKGHIVIEALLVGIVAAKARPLLLLHATAIFAGQHIGRFALPLAMDLDAEQIVAAGAILLANDRLAPARLQCGL